MAGLVSPIQIKGLPLQAQSNVLLCHSDHAYDFSPWLIMLYLIDQSIISTSISNRIQPTYSSPMVQARI